ncbi:putative alcohol dehydrogenase [Coniochaeta sp. 2T2.1]|nr:putative alcohol dehydrogenase [Coniochaeta sp. 2T2.1]
MASELPRAFVLDDETKGTIPAIGLGTFQPEAAPPSIVKQAVLDALHAGYRHIDTAWMYGDGTVERAVGEAIRDWGGPRDALFVVTKLANAHHKPEDVAPALESSLANLGLGYDPIAYVRAGQGAVDEWGTSRHRDGKPKFDVELSIDFSSTWAAMEDLVSAGKAKHVGVSNFSALKLHRLLQGARRKPAVNQVEMHPYLPQAELLKFCREHGIHVTAHMPLGGRPVAQVAPHKDKSGPVQDITVCAIATKNGRTPADTLLQWAIQRGTSVVPKAYTHGHILSNLRVLDYPELSLEDMKAIDNLGSTEKGQLRFMDPSGYWGFDIFDEERDYPIRDDLEG